MDEQETVVETQAPVQQPRSNPYAVPAAIVFGFALIAAAIFFTGDKTVQPSPQQKETAQQEETLPTGPASPVTAEDHILGNPNAPIVIVEYSDFDCPFCKNFHMTMKQIMDDYGADGKVAWVYRHFPLEQLHPSAPHIAAASECVAKLGGNESFWKFADLIFEERETNQPTNTARLGEFAQTAGVDEAAFNACVQNKETTDLVEADFVDGLKAGAKGTPYSVIQVAGQELVINGAQPYEYVKQNLASILEQLESAETAQ